ncbi:MAG: ABC transporter ATP-binding protein/permease [Dehalococcoidales bacterium]|nr:ABC transporter ATP-binding protein/permease [Dehalococcoidales bacterium]
MSRIDRHLKPFVIAIIFIFALLFGQAMADLALPGYMANIVNIGIQGSGIENSVPEVIRAGEYEKLSLFMTESEQAEVESRYLLLDRNNLPVEDYQEYVEDYPALADQPLYLLDTDDSDSISLLDGIFSRAITGVFALDGTGMPEMPDAPEGAPGMPEGLPGFPEIPEGVDPFEMLAGMTPAERETLFAEMEEQAGAVPDDRFNRSAIFYLVNEYEAIGFNINSIQFNYMFRIGGLMLLITVAGGSLAVIVGYLSARVAAGLARNLRLQLFQRVESFSNTEFDTFSTASLITRSTNDIQQIQMLLVMLFRTVFYAPILGVGGIIRVVSGDASMSWIIAAAVMAMLVMIGIIFVVAVPKFRIIQKLVDKVNLATREMLTGMLVIRAFNTQKHEEAKFDRGNVDLTRVNLFIQRIMVMLMPTMMLIMNGSMILIVWMGAFRVDAGATQVGDLMAFMQYTMQIIMAFLMISTIFIMMPRAIVSIQRINEVLDTEPVIRDPASPQGFPEDVRGYVEFKNVSFRYPNAEEDMLKGISFKAKPGQTTAFIGSTGSGKSTLINLIPRFYDATGGSILVDGVDVREVTQHDLREKIGYVPQKSTLFSGTIESNLRYADEDVDEAVLQKALASAQANDFVKKTERGMGSPVSQGGANLSGGQKQRLSIARALVKKPEIYIFDDSFSALDFKTDSAVRRALKKDTRQSTVLIVTQRLSTIMGAEQIIVIDHGEIVGIGKHKDLMKTCEVYREIAQSQLSKEELGS